MQERLDAPKLALAYRREFGVDVGRLPAASLSLLRCPSCTFGWFYPRWAGDGAFYDRLQLSEAYYLEEKSEYVRFARGVLSEESVLDVGCGIGALAPLLPPSARFVGLELSEAAVQEGRAAGRDIRREDVAVHASSLPQGYDYVTAFQVLEHVADPIGFLQACTSCLAPGGKLVVSVPNDDSYVGRMVNGILNMPPHHVSRWNSASLAAAGDRLGLRTVRVETEPLEAPNIPSCANTMAIHALFPRLARRTFRPRLLGRVTSAPIKAASIPFRLALREPALRPAGHSITAVFESDRPLG